MQRRRQVFTAAIFLLPAFSLYAFFVLNPVAQSVYLSFFRWNGIPKVPLEFVGLTNFVSMFGSDDFWRAVRNSLIFVFTGFFVQLPLAFALASIITRNMRAVRFFKTAYFIPVVLPMTAIGIIWSNLLYPNGGVVNTLLQLIGLDGLARNWLGDPKTAAITTSLVSAWVYAGLNMVILAAGLVAIPQELYECGELDGAVGLSKLRYITLPMMRETLKIYAILAITGAFRVFDIVFVMTHGGPNRASETPAVLLYFESFQYNDFGYGSSVGVFILVTGILVSIALTRVLFREEA